MCESNLQADIEKRRIATAEEYPHVRVAALRRLIRDAPVAPDGTVRLVLDAPAGPQPLVLEPERRGFGVRYNAICACGRRVLLLRLDATAGYWRCNRCLRLRCAKTRFRRNEMFRRVVRPLLDLERVRRRMERRGAAHPKRESFAKLERETLAGVERTLTSMREKDDGREPCAEDNGRSARTP